MPRLLGRVGGRSPLYSGGDTFDETIKEGGGGGGVGGGVPSLALSREVLCVRGGDEPKAVAGVEGSGWSRLLRVSEISTGVLSNKGPDRQVLPSRDQSIGCRTSGALRQG